MTPAASISLRSSSRHAPPAIERKVDDARQVGWQFDTFFVEDGDPLASKEAEEDTDLKDDVLPSPWRQGRPVFLPGATFVIASEECNCECGTRGHDVQASR